MTVIETPSFLRDAKRLMDDEERQEIVAFLGLRTPMRGTSCKGPAESERFVLRGMAAVEAAGIG